MLAAVMLLSLFAWWRFWFFLRNPKREIVANDARILSPADGFVIYIRRVEPGDAIFAIKGRQVIHLEDLMQLGDARLNDRRGWLVGIYMSPFDVHYNRAPIRGHLRKLGHGFPGAARRNLTMFDGQANLTFDVRPYWTECDYLVTNERASYVIANEARALYVTQIADRWVRKIVSFVDDAEVSQGQVFGLIRMGSQVDLFVPDDGLELAVRVRERQHVKAGLTTLFELKSSTATNRPAAPAP
ncbi:MAG: phosphatidylserine decarboxylase [Deltaproteobacteria bacterium]|nr:phosphatidylserine decarboxylase [Deltaproteobacteria bacterium]